MTPKTPAEKKPGNPRRARPRKGGTTSTAAAAPSGSDRHAASAQDTDVAARIVRHDDAEAFLPDPERAHGPVADDLAEFLGEGFVQAATSGEDLDNEENDAVQPEELGGPFIETDARTEFGDDRGAPRSRGRAAARGSATTLKGAEGEDVPLAEAFPTALRAGIEPAHSIAEALLPGASSPDEGDGDTDGDDEEEDDDELSPSPDGSHRGR